MRHVADMLQAWQWASFNRVPHCRQLPLTAPSLLPEDELQAWQGAHLPHAAPPLQAAASHCAPTAACK